MKSRALTLATLFVATQLTGCAVFRSYDNELKETNQHLTTGNVDAALAVLEKNNTSDDKDLLYWFEKGELLRSKGDLAGSQNAWHEADGMVFKWEESVKLDTDKYLSQFGSYLVNDKVRRYEGYDYEKVMLTTQMALNLLARNDFEGARTEIKKTHEREALIAELRDKEYLKREEQAERQGVRTAYKDLQGYPVASLDAPEVISLKNSYQSAFSHYLSGYVYEALGEQGLAAPGYRKAAELLPNTPLLEQALLDLDKAPGKSDDQHKDSDVLIVVQSGLAPARDSRSFALPLIVQGNLVLTPLSFPVIREDTSTAPVGQVSLDDKPLSLTALNSTSAMSRRALRDDMPGIILRSTVRAATRVVAQKKLNETNPMAGLVLGLAAAITEGADTRTWRTLPNDTLVTRVRLSQGEHRLNLGSGKVTVTIDRPYHVIALRRIGSQLYTAGQSVHPVIPPASASAVASLK